MTDLNGVALRDLPEALASQRPDDQRLHAATLRDTHSDIFMKGKAMSKRERWAYEELQAGEIIQEGDEWWPKDGTGQWQAYHQGMFGLQVLDASVARRPHNITALQSERDEFQTALIESRLSLKRKVAEIMEVCKERDNAENALKSTQRARDELQLQVDELRVDRTNEVTARQVQEVLRRWATELDWSAGCFGSFGRSQIDIIQQTMIAVIQRIESMIDAEGSRAND